jgi:NAD-dependent SIR2 family protein deacetylase
MHKAIPSVCHMSLVKLIEEGHLKHIISQNIDGLHRKSGVPADKISELHGN